MKITFSKKALTELPKDVVRVRLTEDDRGVRRIVRENGCDTLEMGVGNGSEMNQRRFITLTRALIQSAKQHKAKCIAVSFDDAKLFKNLKATTPERLIELACENFEMANFEYTTYKTKPKDGWNEVEEVLITQASSKSLIEAVKRGQEVGRAVNACRALSNTPGGEMTPKMLARAAKQAAKDLPITVTTLTKTQIEKLGMGALLGVALGSTEDPSFTIMEYKGSTDKPIVLVGKGITFDSGGLNLKPSNGIYEMHMDMSGASAMLHTVVLAAKLKLKKHVIALLPAAENMPSGNAVRPGDVLRSLSGKTIEVLNTDAEGRLVLADALTYAKRLKPSVVIDAATLTGAAHIALGNYASALMTRDDALADTLATLGEESGEYVWRLPLWDEYESSIKGVFADLANVAVNGSRYGGAIEGGIFLWQFARDLDCPWAHIDIAPRMTSVHGDELAKGAAGAPVRLLIRFIETWKA